VRILGIDEAGRGCVLGDLVIGGFLVEAEGSDGLQAAGADDSKKLSAAKRLKVRTALTELGVADIRRITPTQIDAGNLNTLEEEVIVDLVRTHRPDRVIVDALGPPSSLGRVVARLQHAAGVPAEWLMEPKADANHPPVGAASIFAKTTRDERLDALKEEFGDFGSGYPSDPKTRTWLLEWARSRRAWPSFVRTRWQTVRDLAQQALL